MKDDLFDWHGRWDEGRIGFHKDEVNPKLVRHVKSLERGPVLVPLCGKSKDLAYLRDAGLGSIGVELVELAVRQLFEEEGVEFTRDGDLFRGGGLHVVRGDFFAVELEPVWSIWDRAALIALPPASRERYRDRILSLLQSGGAYLLNTLEYEEGVIEGPPFSIGDDEVERLFGKAGKLRRLEREEASLPPSAGGTMGSESLFLLTRS